MRWKFRHFKFVFKTAVEAAHSKEVDSMSVGEHIIHKYDLFFDHADPLNASLYLCVPAGAGDLAVYAAIGRLGDAGLWSNQPAKSVAENQKPAYAEQMRFVACLEFHTKAGVLLLARYTHPKFVSNDDRWGKWATCLSALAVAG
jgi:hypothetical protein